MAIIKDTIHPHNNINDILYPKTSFDQVEGLSEEIEKKLVTLHRISFSYGNAFFVLNLYCTRKEKFTSLNDLFIYYRETNNKDNSYYLYLFGNIRIFFNNFYYYGLGSVVIQNNRFSYNCVLGNTSMGVKFFDGSSYFSGATGFDDFILGG